MTITITSKVQINATPGAVFKFLKDLKYHYIWNPHLREIDDLKPLSKGSTYSTMSSLFGIVVTGQNTVTKFVPDKEIKIENNTGTIKYSADYTLKAVGAHKVIVTCSTDVTTTGFAMKFTGRALSAMIRRELQSDLQALKVAAEHNLS